MRTAGENYCPCSSGNTPAAAWEKGCEGVGERQAKARRSSALRGLGQSETWEGEAEHPACAPISPPHGNQRVGESGRRLRTSASLGQTVRMWYE